jgi:hypothetical protein
MSETDIPSRFGPAVKWALTVIVLVVLGLGISDSLREGQYGVGAIYAALFFVTFTVAVKWNAIASHWRARGLATVLLVGIVGTWLFMTVCLGAAAWMIWTQQGFTIGSSAIGGQTTPSDEGPIQWAGGFSIDGNLTSKIVALRFLGVNISKTKAIQLKEANIVSAIDGALLPLEIVAVDSTGNNKIVPISKVQLIPPGARIELIAKFGDPDPSAPGHVLGLEPRAFLEKWRQFSFNVMDDVRTYRNDYNDSHMMPFFQGQVGPRVMIKPDPSG